ncbi:MAG TPA: FtsW/RodA/SpoVE family cell cycle protein [Longilinea sp.]|nr:FtsW/RodA/SpoVE family cell cycle protein [Longilinea sp.]
MGESTEVTSTFRPTRTVRSMRTPRAATRLSAMFHGVDVVLLLTVFGLCVFGLLMVNSSSWKFSLQYYGSTGAMFQRQLIWFAVGVVALAITVLVDYHVIMKLSVYAWFAVLAMLAFVALGLGATVLGANRTLLGGSIQPSEFAKLIIIIYLSYWLYSKQDKLGQLSFGLIPLGCIQALTGGLIFMQPDISAALTVFLLSSVLFFLAGGKFRQIIPTATVAVVAIVLFIMVTGLGRGRLDMYVSGLQSPANASDQVKRSIEAIVRGGFFGIGIGQSETKFTGLPVPPTDSIYAVIVEETGLLGASLVVVLYMLFLWRGLLIAKRAPDMPGKLMAAGITFWIVTEAIINMGAMSNLLPFAGNALPFISYGGSSLLSVMAGTGILLGIGRRTEMEKQPSEGRPTGAVVDLRRRDGRRGVSRVVRPTGPRQ